MGTQLAITSICQSSYLTMADHTPLGPQPSPERIQEHFQGLTTEFARLPNIPALASGDAILRALAELTEKVDRSFAQINQRFNQVDRRFDQTDRKIDSLADRIVASDYNSTARVQNSLLVTPSSPLSPLVNPANNAPVEGFPARPQDILAMGAGQLDSVMLDLGLRTNGTRSAKEKRLRQYIGLRPVSGA